MYTRITKYRASVIIQATSYTLFIIPLYLNLFTHTILNATSDLHLTIIGTRRFPPTNHHTPRPFITTPRHNKDHHGHHWDKESPILASSASSRQYADPSAEGGQKELLHTSASTP
ncbi:hypothetical protein E2C01_044636 [Portunus trituberculatus]|uniref:Uncharacterized protein n=1 Tax=Portunus trituberculatus TaxID=210409 RepID=A0A5B7FW51_PORTR|nr:hypothetical protein [Portunus trituberculatus]